MAFFSSNKFFWIPMAAYLLLGAWIVSQFPKGELEIAFNQMHQPPLDDIFLGFTYIGDGIALVFCLVCALFFNVYRGLIGGLAYAISTLITHFFKRIVFADHYRPSRFFEGNTSIYYLKDLEMHTHNSFPSGHTSAAFCVFAFLAFTSSDKRWGLLFWLMAFMVALSRVYLMQHFFVDIYFGAILGVVVAATVYLWGEKYFSFKHRLSKRLYPYK